VRHLFEVSADRQRIVGLIDTSDPDQGARLEKKQGKLLRSCRARPWPFPWSDSVPRWLQGVCLFTLAAGYALALWAMRVNRFFS
jgi:hypothetical protein